MSSELGARREGLSKSQIKLLAFLHSSPQACHSTRKLALSLDLSHSTVELAISRLADLRYIHTRPGTRTAPNQYTILRLPPVLLAGAPIYQIEVSTGAPILGQGAPISTVEPRNPNFPQRAYKEVLSCLLSTDKSEGEKPEQWKTEPDPPPHPEAKTFSVEVVEFAEVCMEKKIIGVLRTQFGTLPHDLGIEPGIVAEFVARKWHEVWKRGRGKLHEDFTVKALYGFVRKDLAKAYGIELPETVMPPRRPPGWERSDRLQHHPYAAGEGRR